MAPGRGNVSAVKSLERMIDCEREKNKTQLARKGGMVHYTMYLPGVIQLPWPVPGAWEEGVCVCGRPSVETGVWISFSISLYLSPNANDTRELLEAVPLERSSKQAVLSSFHLKSTSTSCFEGAFSYWDVGGF